VSARVRFGVTTMATDPPQRFRELVGLVETAGFDELWVCDSSVHGRDVWSYLTLAATASERLRLGPNCTHPYTRHPAITLNAAATLHELSGGRAALAVGAGDRPVTELGCRPAPVAVVREMITLFRRLEAGEAVNAEEPFKGKGVRLSFGLGAPLPIYVAASGPRMLEMAGEVADGVLFFSGVHRACIEWALEKIRAGMKRAERAPASLDVACTIAGSLSDDLDRARAECVPMAAWFPQTAPEYATLVGVPPTVVEAIRSAYAGGHFDAARRAFAHVTDPMVEAFTVAGPAELWVRRIKEVVAAGVTHVNIFLLSADKSAMVRELAERVLPHVASA
jgi:5,10-methylenetetrahydromethanopterin reductase